MFSSTEAGLRAGVDIFWDQGTQTAVAWHQWLPPSSVDFSNFTVLPGDSVRITAQATSNTDGSVTIENFGPPAVSATAVSYRSNTPLQTASQEYTGQSSLLSQSDAAWIIEDFPSRARLGSQLALANFSAITYSDLSVGTRRVVEQLEHPQPKY